MDYIEKKNITRNSYLLKSKPNGTSLSCETDLGDSNNSFCDDNDEWVSSKLSTWVTHADKQWSCMTAYFPKRFWALCSMKLDTHFFPINNRMTTVATAMAGQQR